MDRKTLFAIVGIVILIAGAFVYVIMKPNAPMNNGSNTTTEEKTSASTNSTSVPTTQMNKGVYIDYSADLIASTPGTKLLFFHAPWCPQCRAIEASIKTSGLPDGVTVLKVDYDTNQQLRQQYGVTLQTTFVKIDDDGNKTASYVAYEEPEFSSVQRALLP